MHWEDQLPTLESERVSLRWLTEADRDDLFAVFSDPEVMQHWSSAAWTEAAEASSYIASIHEYFGSKELFQFGICLKESNTIVGTCTLSDVDFTQKRAEAGIILGRPSWGMGLGTESLEILLAWAFKELGLMRIEADIDPNNPRSLALFEKQGFQREGLLRERWRVHGEVQDTVFLGLLVREWKGRS
ncbi:MAG: GNAT family N-acetyltransferase [Planctomycetota bacterium]|nr:MAG: GNAT family N-acetyltransferase [Planctomycetota bacterium]